MATDALTLSNLSGPHIELACSKCERRDRLWRDKLIAQYGSDIRLPDLLAELASDCPRRGNYYEACGAYYPASKPKVQASVFGSAPGTDRTPL
jgi:hypothetical protein